MTIILYKEKKKIPNWGFSITSTYFLISLCFVCFLHHLQNFLSSIFWVTSFLFLLDQ